VTRRSAKGEGALARRLLIGVGLVFLALFLVLPLLVVFVQAFSKGWGAFAAAIVEPDALAAIRLTLLVAAISVPLNCVFGVVASWAIT
jgi:sulfate transport system permease protein